MDPARGHGLLRDKRSRSGGQGLLAVTEDMSGPTKDKVRRILDKYVPDAEIVYLKEDDIKETARRFAEEWYAARSIRLSASSRASCSSEWAVSCSGT